MYYKFTLPPLPLLKMYLEYVLGTHLKSFSSKQNTAGVLLYDHLYSDEGTSFGGVGCMVPFLTFKIVPISLPSDEIMYDYKYE